MRTGAIFARGSCRALKWMVLVGMVFALGVGSAAAQAKPTKPVLTVKGASDTSVTLEWTLPPGGPALVSPFFQTQDGVATTTFTATAPAPDDVSGATASTRTVTITGVAAGTEHAFRVAAVGANGKTWSDTKTFTTETPPTAPATFTVASGDKSATLMWTPGAGGGPVRYYEYNFKLGTNSDDFTSAADAKKWKRVPGGSGARRVMISGLTNGRSYVFGVRAVNNGGSTIAGTLVAETPSGLPGAPTGLTATPGTPAAGKVAVTLAWTEPASDGGADIRYYEYQVDSQAYKATADASTFVVVSGLDADMAGGYTYRVRAVNDNGVGPAASTDPMAGALTFTPATQPDIPATVGTALAAVALPVASGGTGTISYMTTTLPAGLTFTAATRTISGTPTGPAGTTAVTYTATDSATPTAVMNSLTFNIVIAAAGTTPTPTTATDGVITAVVVGDPKTDAPVRTIGGTKRVHVTEGALTKLTITGRWTHEQLAALWKDKTATNPPTPATVTVRVMAATPNQWLSPAETREDPGPATFGGQDVVLASNSVAIAIPTKPTGANAASPLYTKERSGSISLSLPHDVDAEDEGFMVEVVSGSGMGLVTDRTRSMWTTDPPVIVIEDDETQGIVLTLDPPRTTAATPRLFEGSSYKFKAVAKPAREDLPLQVRYNVTDLSGVSVSSRLRQYTLTESGGLIPVGTGADAKDNVTLGLPANDEDRVDEELEIHAEVVSFSLNSGAFDDIDTSTIKFTAVDVHKLPELTVSPSTGTVKEGGEIELTLMIDRNPANTTVSSTEKLEYTNEEVTVMLTAGAGSTAGATDFSVASVKFPKRTKGLYTDEMKVKVMALVDDEIDGGEMLVLDAMLKGSETKNGSEGRSDPAKATLTIEDATQKLVYAKTQKEVEDAVYAAKKAAEGDDMKFTPGEMMEVMGSALFSAAEGVTVSYTAMSSEPSVASVSVSGGTVVVTAATEGMAEITITAHGMSPSGVKILDQTDPDAASIMFPVEVGLEALSIELTGPDDMNLVEGGMGGRVTATANRAVTADTKVMLVRDRAMSSASDDDYTAEPITILAGQMSGSTMVMATADDMMENDGNMTEELVLYGMTENNAGAVTGEVKFYLWDAAVPALPIITQLLLGGLLAVGGYRRYRRR